jgi:ubiquinone/menaquinone biosynthesis C-methylase UbiE
MQLAESVETSGAWEQAVEWLRQQPELQEFVRQCYYDDPVLDAAERFCASEEWSAIRELLDDYLPGRVLELGAGRGIVSFAFANVGCEVTALEPDASPLVGRGAIEELSRHSPQPLRILSEWGERIPAGDASFDVVFSRCVLHHANDLRQLCREVFRVLRPGGMFFAEREHVIEKREHLRTF